MTESLLINYFNRVEAARGQYGNFYAKHRISRRKHVSIASARVAISFRRGLNFVGISRRSPNLIESGQRTMNLVKNENRRNVPKYKNLQTRSTLTRNYKNGKKELSYEFCQKWSKIFETCRKWSKL